MIPALRVKVVKGSAAEGHPAVSMGNDEPCQLVVRDEPGEFDRKLVPAEREKYCPPRSVDRRRRRRRARADPRRSANEARGRRIASLPQGRKAAASDRRIPTGCSDRTCSPVPIFQHHRDPQPTERAFCSPQPPAEFTPLREVCERSPAELHADGYARGAYSTLANGQSDSSHSLTACQRGVSRCAWLSRTHESAQASMSLSRSG